MKIKLSEKVRIFLYGLFRQAVEKLSTAFLYVHLIHDDTALMLYNRSNF